MSGPLGEPLAREKIIFREWHQNSPTYGHVTILFLELEFQSKENKQMNMNSQQNLAVFSAGIDSENKIIKMLHRKGQKTKYWTDLSLLGQEPTFKYHNQLFIRLFK